MVLKVRKDNDVQRKMQSRNQIYVTGLPEYLSEETIAKYFEQFGKIKEGKNERKMIWLLRHPVTKRFNGKCKITFELECSARNIVQILNGVDFKGTGCVLNISMALVRTYGKKPIIEDGDWICQGCSQPESPRINFEWQGKCFHCGRMRSSMALVDHRPSDQIFRRGGDNVDDPEDRLESDMEYKRSESPEQTATQVKVEIIPQTEFQEHHERITNSSLDSIESSYSVIEKELEDVLLNTFMNNAMFKDNFPLKVHISVSKLVKREHLPQPANHRINVKLDVDPEMEEPKCQQETERIAPENVPTILQPTDITNLPSTSPRKKFTLDQDKKILNHVVSVLPGKSLATLDLPETELASLSSSLSRCQSSINCRWRGKLRPWLIQYYSKNHKSWKKFTNKASLERRQKAAGYFQSLVKKKGLTVELLNVSLKQ